MHNSQDYHWNDVTRILRYLQETISHYLHFQKPSNLNLMTFFDFDWASDFDDRNLQ